MEVFTSNLVNPSFEHVLHSYDFCKISTYKYEVKKYFFDSISYLLNNQLSYLKVRHNNMAHLNQCLLLNVEKIQQCHIQDFFNLIYNKL
jgi:hypothetical protein